MSFNRFCSIGHRGACERKGDTPRPGRARRRRRRGARFRGGLLAAAEVADAAPATAPRPDGPCCAVAALPRLSGRSGLRARVVARRRCSFCLEATAPLGMAPLSIALSLIVRSGSGA